MARTELHGPCERQSEPFSRWVLAVWAKPRAPGRARPACTTGDSAASWRDREMSLPAPPRLHNTHNRRCRCNNGWRSPTMGCPSAWASRARLRSALPLAHPLDHARRPRPPLREAQTEPQPAQHAHDALDRRGLGPRPARNSRRSEASPRAPAAGELSRPCRTLPRWQRLDQPGCNHW